MEQDEFKKLYTGIEQKLGDKYWLIPRDRAMLFIGAVNSGDMILNSIQHDVPALR